MSAVIETINPLLELASDAAIRGFINSVPYVTAAVEGAVEEIEGLAGEGGGRGEKRRTGQ